MADALASGASEGFLVGVQVPPRPRRVPAQAGASSRLEGPTFYQCARKYLARVAGQLVDRPSIGRQHALHVGAAQGGRRHPRALVGRRRADACGDRHGPQEAVRLLPPDRRRACGGCRVRAVFLAALRPTERRSRPRAPLWGRSDGPRTTSRMATPSGRQMQLTGHSPTTTASSVSTPFLCRWTRSRADVPMPYLARHLASERVGTPRFRFKDKGPTFHGWLADERKRVKSNRPMSTSASTWRPA